MEDYDFYKNYNLVQKKSVYHKKGLCGLVNLGNTCFMNSIIQCLSNTLSLTDYFLSKSHIEDDPEHMNKRKPEYLFLNSWVNLLVNIWESNQLLKPKTFVENFGQQIKKYANFQQQDSHECLMYFLDILHRSLSYEIEADIRGEIKNSHDKLMKQSLESWKSFYETNYSFIINTFSGLLHNSVICLNCKHEENRFEPYNNLSIDINFENTNDNVSVDLNGCLKNYFKTAETINTWRCDQCKANGCQKKCSLWSVPNYLIIHFKRFSPSGRKIHKRVNFNLDDLDITNYISDDKLDKNNYIYSLYAVNYHSGELNSGHYWSCCKNLDNTWYLFNDGHVSKFHNINDIITKDAYILFYHRKFIR